VLSSSGRAPPGVPVGVHAYSGDEAAAHAAEGSTIVMVAVDAVSLGEDMAHHLGAARGRSEPDQL
jgi:4-hydroxy-2-oxoheptanedioate aldolase